MRVSLLLPLLGLCVLFAGAMSQGTATFSCPHDGCTYTHWTKAGISGHFKKHVGGAAVAAAAAAAAAPAAEGYQGDDEAMQAPARGAAAALGREGGGGDGGDTSSEEEGGGGGGAEEELEPLADLHEEQLEPDDDGARAARDAEADDADAAALAAMKAANIVALPAALPVSAADLEIAAAQRGVEALQRRKRYEDFQLGVIGKPGALHNLSIAKSFSSIGLSLLERDSMRQCFSGKGAPCLGCACPNHASVSPWGEQRRNTATWTLVESDGLCAPLFLENARNDSVLGPASMKLELPTVIFSLRAHTERIARSYAHAPGTFLYLDGKGVADDSGGCVGLCHTELVLQGAAAAHKNWDESAAKPILTEWATRAGFSKVLLVPFPWRGAEDATNATTRTSLGAVHVKPDNLAPHCQNHDHLVLLNGLITKPPWKEGALPRENAEWAENAYHQSLAEAYGLTELINWDKEGLLLVDRFPGLSEQPPEGERWLHVLSPYLSGISGDLQGCYKSFGLKLNVSCPCCVVASGDFNSDTCGKCERWDPNVVLYVEHHRKKYSSGTAAEKKVACAALNSLGINPDVKSCFDWATSFGASWRVPHTVGAISTPYRYYAIDVLHVRSRCHPSPTLATLSSNVTSPPPLPAPPTLSFFAVVAPGHV